MKFKLDAYEKEIEKNIDTFVPVSKSERKRIETLIAKSKKKKNINIRISEQDLYLLRLRSVEEGIPYQTLISSVLHKYLGNRLFEEAAIVKTMQLLRGKRK
jgi:predicted DNA binding CopG/RHH family protein